MNKQSRITSADINKQCFVKFSSAHGKDTWENVGALIAAIHKDRILIKMPDGEVVAVASEDVRVFEPRPRVR